MTPRTPRVYGWLSGDYRYIMAAPSKAEIARVLGRPESWIRNVRESKDSREIRVALETPGVMYRRPLKDKTALFTTS